MTRDPFEVTRGQFLSRLGLLTFPFIAKELGGYVDQVVITNGEAGYRYSQLAESFYGERLSEEKVGRLRLPEIRKRETIAAGKILGIRNH